MTWASSCKHWPVRRLDRKRERGTKRGDNCLGAQKREKRANALSEKMSGGLRG